MNIFIMNPRKHLVFLVLFTFNFLLHSSMASSQVQSFPPQNFTLLGDSYLRHGVAGLTLESNFLSASSGTITYTRPVRFTGSKELLFMKKSEREGFADKKDTTTPSNVNVAASVDEQTPVNSQTSAAHEFGTSKSDFDEMLELDMNPISVYDDGLRLHDIRLSFSDDGLHDSRLSLSDDGLHDSRETTVIDDDSFDSERVGSFCTMSQILVHWRPTEEEAIYNYFISNIAAYVPTVQQKGERYISKVKALEAGKAAKRREDKKEKERRMKKEAFKMERERAKKEKEREMELNRKIKQEEMKKREADMAARKKQREKEERAKKRKEEKRWRL
ncbi:hypothetical protein L1887_61953 [Cichorium endivia]|nr:hypothetical protein L1887_61953 [Cichorium endivia]